MIEIRLVKIGDRLVGADFSSRWNLAQLEATSIPYTRNGNMVKKFRRMHPDFSFTTGKGEMVGITTEERRMFTTTYARMVA
jgi:hypothetical protein